MRETNSLRFNIRPEARANITQRAAKPISIARRDRVISRNRRTDQTKDLLAARDPARGRQVRGKKKEADVYIAARISAGRDPPGASYERIPGTPHGFQPCYSYVTHLPRLLNRELKSAQLFKYRSIIKLARELVRSTREITRAAPPAELCTCFRMYPASSPIHST